MKFALRYLFLSRLHAHVGSDARERERERERESRGAEVIQTFLGKDDNSRCTVLPAITRGTERKK